MFNFCAAPESSSLDSLIAASIEDYRKRNELDQKSLASSPSPQKKSPDNKSNPNLSKINILKPNSPTKKRHIVTSNHYFEKRKEQVFTKKRSRLESMKGINRQEQAAKLLGTQKQHRLARNKMTALIEQRIQQVFYVSSTEDEKDSLTLRKPFFLAQTLESRLYENAPSFVAYLDVSTLEERLRILCMIVGRKIEMALRRRNQKRNTNSSPTQCIEGEEKDSSASQEEYVCVIG